MSRCISQKLAQEDEIRNREAGQNGRISNQRDTPIRILQLSDRSRKCEKREEKKTRENGKYYSPQTEKAF